MAKEKRLLFVIDVQNFFINEYTKEIPKKINSYLQEKKSDYDFIIFTKFINRKVSPFYKKLNFKDCLAGEQIEIAEELKCSISKNNLFIKNTYSAFQNKKILSFVKKHKVNKIDLCGLTSDGCVLATAFDGFDRNFDVKVLRDLTGTCWGPEKFNQVCLDLIGYKIDPSIISINKK